MKFYHVVNTYEAKNRDEQLRNEGAAYSWNKLYAEQGLIPIHVNIKDLSRNSQTELGDTRKLPFVRDLIEIGIAHTESDDDVIIFTNTDIGLSQNIIKKCKERLKTNNAMYSVRRESWKHFEHALNISEIKRLRQAIHCADTFIFKVSWWKKYTKKYPDFIIGCQWFDVVLLDLIEASNKEAMLKDVSYHVKHNSFWSWEDNWHKNVGQVYNKNLAKFFKSPWKKSWLYSCINWDNDQQEKRSHSFKVQLSPYHVCYM